MKKRYEVKTFAISKRATLHFLVFVWGLNWAVIKMGLNIVPPTTFLLHQFIISIIALFPILLRLRKRIPRDGDTLGKLMLLGLIYTSSAAASRIGLVDENVGARVVLVLGIIPALGAKELARKLGIQVGSDDFFLEKHYKLRPVDSQREGIFVAGCALSPKDIRETTLESMAVASRVATFVGKGEVSVSPEAARVTPEKCDGCGICSKICPVAAIEKAPNSVVINSVSCVGCGVCLPKCPKEAIDLDNSTEDQLVAQIHSMSQDTTTQ